MPRIRDRFDWPRLLAARCRVLNLKVSTVELHLSITKCFFPTFHIKTNLFEAEQGTSDPVGKVYYDISNKLVKKLK